MILIQCGNNFETKFKFFDENSILSSKKFQITKLLDDIFTNHYMINDIISHRITKKFDYAFFPNRK